MVRNDVLTVAKTKELEAGLQRRREVAATVHFRPVLLRRRKSQETAKTPKGNFVMKNQRILRNILISVGVLFALTPLLTADASDGVQNFDRRSFVPSQPTFLTFDAPGAVNGTYGQAVNPSGVIAGIYIDENFVFHGFVRDRDGTINAFDAPGAAGTEIGGNDLFAPGAMTPAGTITGTYFDESFVSHGFLRTPDGSLTTFDVPGAVYGTNAEAINSLGAITGFYTDPNFVTHGFLRAPDGTLTTFDAPGAVFGTLPSALDVQGAVTGQSFDGNSVHGFVRNADGSFAAFDPTNSTYTQPSDINAEGTITGYYADASDVWHGFVRGRNGAITIVDAPGAGTGPFQGTSPGAINAVGTVTGFYSDADGVFHGFVRGRNGAITTFDAPDSTGTFALAINAHGVVTGVFFDAGGVGHGFVRTP
jgi:hypothetical protein